MVCQASAIEEMDILVGIRLINQGASANNFSTCYLSIWFKYIKIGLSRMPWPFSDSCFAVMQKYVLKPLFANFTCAFSFLGHQWVHSWKLPRMLQSQAVLHHPLFLWTASKVQVGECVLQISNCFIICEQGHKYVFFFPGSVKWMHCERAHTAV